MQHLVRFSATDYPNHPLNGVLEEGSLPTDTKKDGSKTKTVILVTKRKEKLNCRLYQSC